MLAARSAGKQPACIERHTHPLHDPLRCFKFRHSFDSMSDSTSRFGFVSFAETWNGRLAMLGFVIGLATELLTGQGILSQIGLG
jgi:hypothetical protein